MTPTNGVMNMSNWISVTEEVPEHGVCVDLYMDWQDCTGRVCNCFLGDNGFWKWDDEVRFKTKIPSHMITHWMIIPNPPKDGE